MRLENRVILVTGAGYGIGRTAALTYAREGATVILLGRTEQALNATYDLIEAENLPQPAVVPSDLETTDEEPYEQLAQIIVGNFGRLAAELINAGVSGPGTMGATYNGETWTRAR